MEVEWIDPIQLRLGDDDSQTALIKRLKTEIKGSTTDKDLKRSVYIVRLVGREVIVYNNSYVSPVVYVGRGDSVSRLASHLKRWAAQAFTWGHDIGLEIRIVRPEVADDDNGFKFVEADLLRWFHEKAGLLPLMNSRFETSWENGVEYKASDEKRLRSLLSVGKGKRPHWAIYPLKSNPHFERYYKNMG